MDGPADLIPIRICNRHDRQECERFKSFTYEELTKRDKVNLDIFWLKDDALEESANLPAPEVIAADITADLEAALEQFATIAEDLSPNSEVEMPSSSGTGFQPVSCGSPRGKNLPRDRPRNWTGRMPVPLLFAACLFRSSG